MTPATMTGADVLRVARERGFAVRLDPGPPPMPLLCDPGGDTPKPTEPLFGLLRAFRDEILIELAKEAPNDSAR